MRAKPPEGLRVKYQYIRDDPEATLRLHPRWSIEGTKGTTVARLFDADDTVVAEGVASCGPNDNFSRVIGRDVSLGRALKSLG